MQILLVLNLMALLAGGVVWQSPGLLRSLAAKLSAYATYAERVREEKARLRKERDADYTRTLAALEGME